MPPARQPRRLSALVAVLAVAFAAFTIPATAGVSPVPPPSNDVCVSMSPSGMLHHHVWTDGRARSYALHIPSSLDRRHPAPVILAFHGLGGSGESMIELIGAQALASRTGAVVAAIDGTPTAFGRPGWALSGAGFDADERAVTAVLDDLAKRLCVDSSRVFAMGYSNGSVFAQKLACRADSPIVAVAGVAGPYAGEECSKSAVPVIYFHGTADTIVPFDGGDTVIGPLPSVVDTLAARAAANECAAAAPTSTVRDGVQRQTWSSCQGAELSSYVIEGGGHRWPGSTRMAPRGTQRADVDATDVSWRFFVRTARRLAAQPADGLEESVMSTLWTWWV